jgi:hypothetical protein
MTMGAPTPERMPSSRTRGGGTGRILVVDPGGAAGASTLAARFSPLSEKRCPTEHGQSLLATAVGG